MTTKAAEPATPTTPLRTLTTLEIQAVIPHRYPFLLVDKVDIMEEGKRATLFVCDGDPFEFDSKIEAAFIDGRRIDLSDKQTALEAKYRDKYRQLGILPREGGGAGGGGGGGDGE